MDVICINRYFGWYSNPGHLETIQPSFSDELDQWYAIHKKPMMITEYGAGAIAGIHEVGFCGANVVFYIPLLFICRTLTSCTLRSTRYSISVKKCIFVWVSLSSG